MLFRRGAPDGVFGGFTGFFHTLPGRFGNGFSTIRLMLGDVLPFQGSFLLPVREGVAAPFRLRCHPGLMMPPAFRGVAAMLPNGFVTCSVS